MQYFSFWERNLLDVQLLLTVILILWDTALTICASRADLTLTVLSANVFQLFQNDTPWTVCMTCARFGVTVGCIQILLLLIQYVAHCLDLIFVKLSDAVKTGVLPSVQIYTTMIAFHDTRTRAKTYSPDIRSHFVLSNVWIMNLQSLTVQKAYMVCQTIHCSLTALFRTLQVSMTAALNSAFIAIHNCLQQCTFILCRALIAGTFHNWHCRLVGLLQVCTLLVIMHCIFHWYTAQFEILLLTVMLAYMVWLTIHWRAALGWLCLTPFNHWMLTSRTTVWTLHCALLQWKQLSDWLCCTTMPFDFDMITYLEIDTIHPALQSNMLFAFGTVHTVLEYIGKQLMSCIDVLYETDLHSYMEMLTIHWMALANMTWWRSAQWTWLWLDRTWVFMHSTSLEQDVIPLWHLTIQNRTMLRMAFLSNTEHLQDPVPSPGIVPLRKTGLCTWPSFLKIGLCWWWIWFWMFSGPLNADAPIFIPASLTPPMQPTDVSQTHRNNWGEGWQASTGLSATPDDLLACMTFADGVKLRGMRSPDLILRQAKKRSLKRAFSRVLAHGSTWYRGQHVTLRDFHTQSQDHIPSPALRKTYATVSQPAGRHAPQRRLKTFCWNGGGITPERFQELKIWLHQQQIDVAILTETHWLDTREFADQNWTCVHSGSGNRHTGVMLMLAKKLCPSRNVSWHEVIPGRVVHARVFGLKRPLDVIGIYQYVHKHEYLDDRTHLLEVLQRYVERLPNRNMLCLAGDFNCHLPELSGQTGPAFYHWNGRKTFGAQHTDQHNFAHFVQQLQVIALSGRSAAEGPTYHHPLVTSRIDHCFTRLATADGLAMQVKHLWDFPMNGDGGHIPLLFTLPMSWIPYRPAAADFRFTYQQRLLTRTLCRDLDPRWTDFVQTTNARLAELAQTRTDNETLDRLHALMRQQCVMLQQRPRSHTMLSSEVDLHHALQLKWDHFKGLRRPQLATLPAIFRCWHHFSKHQLLQRQQKPLTDLAKRAKIDILQAQAARAADRHDMYTLYRVITKMSPKHQQTKYKLRLPSGQLADFTEAFDILCSYVRQTWTDGDKPAAYRPLQGGLTQGMPFTQNELAMALTKMNATKASAPPYAPGLVWKHFGAQTAAILFPLLEKWWLGDAIWIPADWKSGWLCFIPKPGKPATSPQMLRPLALCEPLSKTILGLLTSKMLQELAPRLNCYPQFAYHPERSTADAIRKVSQHCLEGRLLLAKPPAQRRGAHHVELSCYGAIQVFLDLQKAFDCVDRTRLLKAFATMELSHDLQLLFQEWNCDTSYTVQHGDHTCAISTNKGIPQGSKGSPLLWSIFICDVLADLAQVTGWQWMTSALTVYADDIHCGQLLHDVTDLHRFLDNLGRLLALLQNAGLMLSPSKSVAILHLRGKTAVQTLHTVIIENTNGKFLRIDTPHLPVLQIPLQTSATYLGATMNYGNFADATMHLRIKAGQNSFRRLRRWLHHTSCLKLTQRYTLWQSTVVAVMFYGLVSTDISISGITKLHATMMKQLRHITGNYAHLTGDTHHTLLQQQGWVSPAAMLQQAVCKMQSNVRSRLEFLPPSDILHSLNWTHLDNLLRRLTSFQVDTPMPDVTLSESMWQCHTCGKNFENSTGLSTHMERVHNIDTRGARRMHIATDAVDGLPHCKHCGKWLANWKNFESHIATHKHLPEAIPDDPLHWMQTWVLQPMGNTVLALLRNDDWETIALDQETCQWIGDHCLLCGTYTGSINKINYHLRSQHQSLIDGVFDRSDKHLLEHLGKPPYMCKFCSKKVSRGHICPVGVQLTLLHMHLCPQPDLPPAAAPRDFNVARDSCAGQPKCAHCDMQCASLATLRTHIQVCARFDATRSQETLPLQPGFCLALQLGSIAEYFAAAGTRAEGTLRCQVCGAAFSGTAQMMIHFRSAHSTFLQTSQPMAVYLQRHMTEAMHCWCNPGPGKITSQHLCLPIRQTAMQILRMSVDLRPPLLAPWPLDCNMLQSTLHSGVTTEFLECLDSHLQVRDFLAALHDPLLRQALLSECILCGTDFAEPTLAVHLRVKHGIQTKGIQFLMEQIATHLDAHPNPDSDFTCSLCGSSSDNRGVSTALGGHHRECVVAHQFCLLLTSKSYDHRAQHCRRPSGTQRSIPAFDPSFAEVSNEIHGAHDGTGGHQAQQESQEQQPAPDQQRRRERERERQEEPEAHHSRRRSRSHRLSEKHGTTGVAHGQPTEIDARRKFLHHFPRLQTPRGTGPDPSVHGPMEGGNDSRDADMQPESPALEDPHPELAPESADGGKGDGTFSGSMCGRPCSDTRGSLAICAVEPGDLQNGRGEQAGNEGGCLAEEVAGAGSQHRLPGCVAGVQSPAQPGRLQGPAEPCPSLAVAGELAARGDLSDPTQHVGPECLELAGCPVEAVHDAAFCSVPASESRPEELVIPSNADGLNFMLSQVRLDNPSSYCYANATVQALLWGFGAQTHFQWTMFGEKQTDLAALLNVSFNDSESLLTLLPSLFVTWNGDGPADAAEFVLHFMTWCRPTCLSGTWSRRLDQGDEKAQRFDSGALHVPITLQNDSASRLLSLQSLIDSWTKEHGMCAGLDQMSPLLCLHIDRFFLDNTGCRQKFAFQVELGRCHFPLFDSDGIASELQAYEPVSLVVHSGNADAGHYRALLRMCSGHPIATDSDRDMAVWAYTDDNKPAEILPHEGIPTALMQNVVLVWLVHVRHICLWNSLQPPGRWLMFLKNLKAWQQEHQDLAAPTTVPHQQVAMDPMAAVLAAMPTFAG